MMRNAMVASMVMYVGAFGRYSRFLVMVGDFFHVFSVITPHHHHAFQNESRILKAHTSIHLPDAIYTTAYAYMGLHGLSTFFAVIEWLTQKLELSTTVLGPEPKRFTT
jgi:hypothetical protein